MERGCAARPAASIGRSRTPNTPQQLRRWRWCKHCPAPLDTQCPAPRPWRTLHHERLTVRLVSLRAYRVQQRSGDAARQQRARRHRQRREAQHAAGGARRAGIDAQAGAAQALPRQEQDGGVDEVELDGGHLLQLGGCMQAQARAQGCFETAADGRLQRSVQPALTHHAHAPHRPRVSGSARWRG